MKKGYFPPNTFHRDLRIDTMTANWYSQHLDAMEEPSLWESSDDTPYLSHDGEPGEVGFIESWLSRSRGP